MRGGISKKTGSLWWSQAKTRRRRLISKSASNNENHVFAIHGQVTAGTCDDCLQSGKLPYFLCPSDLIPVTHSLRLSMKPSNLGTEKQRGHVQIQAWNLHQVILTSSVPTSTMVHFLALSVANTFALHVETVIIRIELQTISHPKEYQIIE